MTNVRNTQRPYWRGWLKAPYRYLVLAASANGNRRGPRRHRRGSQWTSAGHSSLSPGSGANASASHHGSLVFCRRAHNGRPAIFEGARWNEFVPASCRRLLPALGAERAPIHVGNIRRRRPPTPCTDSMALNVNFTFRPGALQQLIHCLPSSPSIQVIRRVPQ